MFAFLAFLQRRFCLFEPGDVTSYSLQLSDLTTLIDNALDNPLDPTRLTISLIIQILA